jgi:hypothetical protein
MSCGNVRSFRTGGTEGETGTTLRGLGTARNVKPFSLLIILVVDRVREFVPSPA